MQSRLWVQRGRRRAAGFFNWNCRGDGLPMSRKPIESEDNAEASSVRRASDVYRNEGSRLNQRHRATAGDIPHQDKKRSQPMSTKGRDHRQRIETTRLLGVARLTTSVFGYERSAASVKVIVHTYADDLSVKAGRGAVKGKLVTLNVVNEDRSWSR